MRNKLLILLVVGLAFCCGWVAAEDFKVYPDPELFSGTQKINIRKAWTKDGVVFVDINEAAAAFGLQLKPSKNKRLILLERQEDFLKLQFELNSSKLLINGRTEELSTALVQYHGQTLVPLAEFLWTIGYFLESSGRKYFVVTRINNIGWKDQTLKIQAMAPLFVESIQDKDGVRFRLKNCILNLPPQVIPVNDGEIREIEFFQESLQPGITAIKIKTPKILKYVVLKEDAESSASIVFDYKPKTGLMLESVKPESPVVCPVMSTSGNVLKEITLVQDRNKDIRITFVTKTGGELFPNIMRLNNPDRLVFSFPKLLIKIPKVMEINSAQVARIRTSQFSWEPLTARVVLDLGNDFRSYEYSKSGLLIVRSKEAVPPEVSIVEVKPVPVEVVKADKPLMGLKVAIIPGHGGNDAGALSRSGYMEKIPTLELSKKIQQQLLAEGAVPLMCRESDENVSLESQADFANRNCADILVSVHFNSFISGTVHGSEAYYYKPIDYPLAKAIYEEIVAIPGFIKHKGLKKAMMHNLNHTKMPGVLIEPLFISNFREEALIKDPLVQDKIAAAVVKGIKKYCKNKLKES